MTRDLSKSNKLRIKLRVIAKPNPEFLVSPGLQLEHFVDKPV